MKPCAASHDLKPPVRWLKAYSDEEDVWSYFEVDADAWPLRQVDLSGPTRTPTTAASLAELPDTNVEGIEAVRQYESKYGVLAEAPIANFGPGIAPPTEIERSEFDSLWPDARSHLEGRDLATKR